MLAGVLVVLVALVVVAAIAWPLLRDRPAQDRDTDAGDGAAWELQDEIEQALGAIREIEFDHRAGNLSDADFAELDRAARAAAADLLRRRDEVRGGTSPRSA